MKHELPIKGRGATFDPPNRFERLSVEDDLEHWENDPDGVAELKRVRTEYFVDASRTVIAKNDSPDIPFEHSLNPYRGCTHGCIYCYARPTHEYLGFSAGLDFESKIMVKADAPDLLHAELSRKGWKPECVSIGGITDPYQPIERKLRLTRRCLEVFLEFGNPTTVITKNHLITRDVDVLSALAAKQLAGAFVSVTTLDPDLTRILEPRTATPKRRLDAIETLARAGVPVGVMVAPVIPGLTDHEMASILSAAADAGATMAGYVPLRLPFAIKDLFDTWLVQHMPDRRDKVLNRVRDMRGGKLNDSNFGSRMRGGGVFADQMKTMFDLATRRAGLNERPLHLSTAHFRRPERPGDQLMLF